MASNLKVHKFKLLKNKTNREIEVRCQDTQLELATQFEALNMPEVSRLVIQRGEQLGIHEPGIREKKYRFYDAQGTECRDRRDPAIRSIGLLFQLDSALS